MTGPGPAPVLAAWPGLLEPALGYALAVVQAITPEVLPRPTPCQGWDVRMLLRHASESLVALHEGIDAGRVGLRPAPDDPAGDPAQIFRDRAGRLLAAWPDGREEIIAIADRQLTLGALIGVGALELAVHGTLATCLLDISPLLVPRTGRHPLFGPPVTVPPQAIPSDQLVAYLGRDPG